MQIFALLEHHQLYHNIYYFSTCFFTYAVCCVPLTSFSISLFILSFMISFASSLKCTLTTYIVPDFRHSPMPQRTTALNTPYLLGNAPNKIPFSWISFSPPWEPPLNFYKVVISTQNKLSRSYRTFVCRFGNFCIKSVIFCLTFLIFCARMASD